MRHAASRRAPILLVLLLPLLFPRPGVSVLQRAAAPPESGQPYQVGGNVTRPEKLSGENPRYTEMARKARVTGVVILEAIIGEHGYVTDLKILKGLPMGLDRAAMDAVQTWRFKPAMRDGVAVSVYYTLTVNFQLQESPFLTFVVQLFMAENSGFMKLLHGRRYAEALALIDGWSAARPPRVETELLELVVFMAQDRLAEAWSLGSAHRGPERYEILYSLAGLASVWARMNAESLSVERRVALFDFGLAAATEAMAAKPEDALEAITNKSLLLREKLPLVLDAAERRELDEQARQLDLLATDLWARRASTAGVVLRRCGEPPQ